MGAIFVGVLTSPPLAQLISSFQGGVSEAVYVIQHCISSWHCIDGVHGRLNQRPKCAKQAWPSRGGGVNIHMDELEPIMAARHEVMAPLLASDQVSLLHDLLATDPFARAVVAEYAAFYGLVDLFQAVLQHAAKIQTCAKWHYISKYVELATCYRPTTGSLHQLAAYHGHACILDALRDNADANYSIENARGGPEEYSDIHVAAERGNVAHLNYILDNIEQHGRQCTKPSCTNKRPHVNYAIGAPLLDTMAAD
ncbi:hypothetical protein As57867_015071, partial [Aphanomyces stellatus]